MLKAMNFGWMHLDGSLLILKNSWFSKTSGSQKLVLMRWFFGARENEEAGDRR